MYWGKSFVPNLSDLQVPAWVGSLSEICEMSGMGMMDKKCKASAQMSKGISGPNNQLDPAMLLRKGKNFSSAS
jgi:hypothetical protein